MREIVINSTNEGQRLDKFLLKYLNTAPKSFIYKMIRKKNIKLNDGKCEGGEILVDTDKITLFLSDETIDKFMEERVISDIKGTISVIYEDENILICNKPAGLLVQPEKTGDDTLIDRILHYLIEKGEYEVSKENSFTPALCNRLDRNTGGIVICGKNLSSLQELNRILRENLVDKFYLAFVCGEIKESGELNSFLTKDDATNQVTISKDTGTKIITKYKPLDNIDGNTLLEVQLVTGKTHQIRAHLQFINHPIIGDRKYGNLYINQKFKKLGIENQLLFAKRIVFNNAEGKLNYLCGKEFSANLPSKMSSVIIR